MTLEPSKKSHNGSMPIDRKGNVAQVAGWIKTTNGTISSPLALANTNITPITIPANFMEIVFSPDADIRVSEDPLMETYFTIPADTVWTVGIGWMNTLYIRAVSTANVDFYFNTLTMLPWVPS